MQDRALMNASAVRAATRREKDALIMVTLRTRTAGAVATARPRGAVSVATPTGGSMELTTSVSEAGFSPLDLLYSALAGCLALSARHAAAQQGLGDRIDGIRVEVGGEKAAGEPSRIAAVRLRLIVTGTISAAEREALVAEAERLCTVSNTLAAGVRLEHAG